MTSNHKNRVRTTSDLIRAGNTSANKDALPGGNNHPGQRAKGVPYAQRSMGTFLAEEAMSGIPEHEQGYAATPPEGVTSGGGHGVEGKGNTLQPANSRTDREKRYEKSRVGIPTRAKFPRGNNQGEHGTTTQAIRRGTTAGQLSLAGNAIGIKEALLDLKAPLGVRSEARVFHGREEPQKKRRHNCQRGVRPREKRCNLRPPAVESSTQVATVKKLMQKGSVNGPAQRALGGRAEVPGATIGRQSAPTVPHAGP